MVKKEATKKQPLPKAQARRTRTIVVLIQDNEGIIDKKLGRTRSQSQGVIQKQIAKQAPKQQEKKVEKTKQKSAPKKDSNKKEKKDEKISSTTKAEKQPEVLDVNSAKDSKPKAAPIKKTAITKKKSPPKKTTPKKSTPKKTPVKDDIKKEDKSTKKSGKKEDKSEKKVEKSEKKVEENEKQILSEKSDKKVADKSDKKGIDKSEKKVVEKSDKKAKSEKKVDPNEEKLQKEPKQTKDTKLPRRTESKATAGIVDVVFCVDTTASMGPYLSQTKNTVKEIIKNITNKASSEDISVRFGFVCYRDHPPQDYTYITKLQNLSTEEEILLFINQQDAQGGGDTPEAVLDGLYDAAKKIEWRDASHTPSLRYIFHVADAPPHGKEFSSQGSAWPDGVPSGVTLDKVAHVINIREIHYRLINVNQTNILDNMKKLFKEKFTNYEETDLTNAKEMDFRVSDMIIRELLPDVDYNE